jgi:hypothetical protein
VEERCFGLKIGIKFGANLLKGRGSWDWTEKLTNFNVFGQILFKNASDACLMAMPLKLY